MQTIKDIIIGTWLGRADDGSGLRTMIYNYGVTFNNNGTGVYVGGNSRKQRK